MSNKVIAYSTPDGGVAICIPALNVFVPVGKDPLENSDFRTLDHEALPETYDKHYRLATIEEIAARDVPAGLEWHIVDSDDLPQDRYFRSAWQHDTGEVSVNMKKARGIHMDNIRDLRNKALKILDVETLKGVDVQKQKQALRDIPQTFDLNNYKTPEELKAAVPEELADPLT